MSIYVSDAGRNIHTNRNPQINKLIIEAAKKMNLKPHHCRIARSRGDYIYKEHSTPSGETLRVRVPKSSLANNNNSNINQNSKNGNGSAIPKVLFEVRMAANSSAPWTVTVPMDGGAASASSASASSSNYSTLPKGGNVEGGDVSEEVDGEPGYQPAQPVATVSGYDTHVLSTPANKKAKNIPPEFLAKGSSAKSPRSPVPLLKIPSSASSDSESAKGSYSTASASSTHSRSSSYNTQVLNLTQEHNRFGSSGNVFGATAALQDNKADLRASSPVGLPSAMKSNKVAASAKEENSSPGGLGNSGSIYFTQLGSSSATLGSDTNVTQSPNNSTSNASTNSNLNTSTEPPMTEELCSPADLEGHYGLDGRFYLLDFSRTQPPELPNRNFKNGHLSRLLRPEFVRSYYKPLCSDAYSGFIKGEASHNADIEDATRHLIEVTVPKFARELETSMAEAREQHRLNKFRVTEFAHSHGINCRHFGRLRRELRDPDFRKLLLLEMIARCIKNNLRWKLREKMKLIALPLEEPYRRLVIDYFNLVFGNTRISEEYWNQWLKKDLEVNFVDSLLESEQSPTFNLKRGYSSKIDDDFLYQLFERVTHMMGMTWGFGPSRTSNFLTDKPFDDTDLEAIGERVKHMNIIAHAHGYFYHLKGLAIRIDDPLGAQKFYEIAIEKFEDALNTDPNNKEILLSMALTHMLAIEDIYANLSNAVFSPTDQRVVKAEEYCLRAIYAEPKYDSFSLFRYAQFLEKCGRLEAAEDYYLMALEADPNNAGCLHCYGQFLSDRGEHDLAEEFFKRASANTVGLKQWPQWYH